MIESSVVPQYGDHKAGRGPEPIYDSARRPLPFWEELVEAWRYRDMVVQLVARDMKVRYKRSVLGIAWTMLNPLMMMVVLTLVFSHLFRVALPHYPIYVLSAMVLWNFFAQSTTAAMIQRPRQVPRSQSRPVIECPARSPQRSPRMPKGTA